MSNKKVKIQLLYFMLFKEYVGIFRQMSFNKQWGVKPFLTKPWTPRWSLIGPYSGNCVKGSAVTAKALERLNGFREQESFTDFVK